MTFWIGLIIIGVAAVAYGIWMSWESSRKARVPLFFMTAAVPFVILGLLWTAGTAIYTMNNPQTVTAETVETQSILSVERTTEGRRNTPVFMYGYENGGATYYKTVPVAGTGIREGDRWELTTEYRYWVNPDVFPVPVLAGSGYVITVPEGETIK